MSEERPKNWFKLTCLGCAIVPCLLGFGAYGYLKYQINKKGAVLPEELAKLRAMGIPTEAKDLAPKSPIPDSENAALTYLRLSTEVPALEKSGEAPELRQALDGYDRFLDDKELIAEALKRRRPIMDEVSKAAALPSCYFARDYTKGASLLFPEYASMKQVAKWFAAQARQQAEAGDLNGALRSIRTAFAIGGHLAEDPTIIAGLVGVAINAIALASLEKVTAFGRNDPAYLAQARTLLENLPPLPNFHHAYGGELVMGRYVIQNLRSLREFEMDAYGDTEESPLPKESPLDRFTMGDPAVRKVFEASYVHHWRNIFEKLPRDPDDWLAESKVMDDESSLIDNDHSFENKVNAFLFPISSGALKSRAAAIAYRRVALLAIRILQDRPHGYPADLTRYGSIAVDPMDGKPMRYKRDGKGFRVWSIDRDLVDDFGLKRASWLKSTSTTYDYVWGFDGSLPVPPKPTEYRRSKSKGGPPRGPGAGPAYGGPGGPGSD